MKDSFAYRAGRHFLQIPEPTNVPDRILRAMDRPTIDHRGPESSWTRPADRGFAQGITHAFARIGIWVFVWFLVFRDNPAEHPRITKEELSALPGYADKATRRRNPVPWGPCFCGCCR